MFATILVALNRSACAEQAFDLAMTLGRVDAAAIVVCTVVDRAAVVWRPASPRSAEEALAEARDDAEKLLADARVRVEAHGLNARVALLFGDPAFEIVKCARAEHADVVVMGTHGWTGIKHVVMGSVAESVLRSAPCPVVVVRDRASLPEIGSEAAS